MPFRLVHIILLLVAFAGTGDVWGQEEGLASYYHNRFHGRKAASGRVHDADELVAAHRTYPFGTFLRVTNLSNMKRVSPIAVLSAKDVSSMSLPVRPNFWILRRKVLPVSVSRLFRAR